ncbi:hypothetical protein [uncultured Methylobacterium sp.]|uniref:hypothetical protein n=1 Tax=uncultured Methylobacterium sp. TaxID=157278 RepID=UPI0035CB22BA
MNRPDAPVTLDPDHPLERLAEICIEAHALIERVGTAEMKTTIEALLLRVGFGLAERVAAERARA